MFDYIAHQKESFSDKPFNNGDAAILTTIANLNFDYFYKKRDAEYLPLGLLAQDFMSVCKGAPHSEEFMLMSLVKNSPRYSDILVSDVVDDVDLSEEKQFGALTFYPEPDLAFVGYAGTGTSVVGYKEDLNMAFMDIIPSQRDAVNYLNRLKDKLPERVMVGGFSKGGNLAVFASAFCNPDIRKKINTVYNHDGPGFSDLILKEEKYKTLKPLIKTYIPSASIVGIILNHDNDYNVIESVNPPLFQHHPYSWVFEGDDLKIIKELSTPSNMIRRMQKRLLKKMSNEERKETVNAIFDFIASVEPDDFINLMDDDKNVSKEFRIAWKNLNPKTKRILRKLLVLLAYSFSHSFYPKKKDKKALTKKEKKALKKEKKRQRKLKRNLRTSDNFNS